jgi:hypothetical protein
MASIANVKVGTCSISVDGTDVGHTAGDVIATYEPSWHDISVNMYGTDTIADKSLIGEKLMVKFTMAESTEANIERAIPMGDGTTAGKVTIGSQAGQRASDSAVQLVLHPIANAAGDRSEDIVLYKAISSEAVEVPFLVDGERVLEVTYTALVDETKSDGNYLGLIGDSAV